MKLYHYDHCPYCVKARMIFGLKNIPVTLQALLNDDEVTPVRMIGKKMVPILEKDDGSYMPESMDIVHAVDGLSGVPIVKKCPPSEALDAWFDKARGLIYPLAMPRWVQAPLEEFRTPGAVEYFTKKKEAMIGSFAENLEKSVVLKREANGLLAALEGMIQSPQAVHGVLSEDDFHLFAALRALSIVKGLIYPPGVEAYRQAMSHAAKVPLHDDMAID